MPKNPIFETENPETDLWGNIIETPLFTRRKKPSIIKRRAGLSSGPAGEKSSNVA